MPMLSDRTERRRIAKLDQRVREIDNAIAAARADFEDLQRRETALNERLAREEAKRPTEDDSASEAAAGALLADPEAATVGFLERITGARRKRETSLADHRAAVKPIKDAIALAQRKQEKTQQEIASLETEREAAWKHFCTELRNTGLAEYQRRSKVLIDELLLPMKALEVSGASHGWSIDAHAHLWEARDGEAPAAYQMFPPLGIVAWDDVLARVRAEFVAERG